MKFKLVFQFLIIASLSLALVGTYSQPSLTAKIQPQLVQTAEERPGTQVRVIVQKLSGATGVEERVAALGGKVTQNLHIINAFAAEMTAEAAVELARADSVRWVSLDAQMSTAAIDSTFTAWASAVGTVTTNTFASNTLMVDSSLGPNNTYAIGANNKGSFMGFSGQAVSGNAISKVELVLKGYVPAILEAAQDPIISPWINGKQGKTAVLNHHAFDTYIGAVNSGFVYFDITSLRNWQWIDFESDLQITIDQSKFKSTTKIYYDAIGLRVTSTPGTDTSLDTFTSATEADSTVDGSQQVNVYNQVIGATQLWNTPSRLQGKGVTVAVVDSGVYKTKDLSKRVKININLNSAFHDAADRFGHGTFVAGIIAGNGSQSRGQYIGVAPKVSLLNVRIADDQGMMYESDLIAALQWVYDNKTTHNIRVVNLSLNSSVAQSYHTSPLDAACEILWFNGIVVVVSAGNNGTSTLFPPANDPFVITIGATDDKATLSTADDTMATFSAYGVTESGFAKPDLVAPGCNIIGLLPENNRLSIGLDHQANRVDNTYFKMSGTSVSAPMVSGAVAILLQDEPTLNPDQVKYRLMATANKNWAGYNASMAGAGYLDIYAAVYGTTTESANTGTLASQLLSTGSDPITWGSVGWNSVGWNSVGWNSVGWNSVGWNSVGWNSDYWGP